MKKNTQNITAMDAEPAMNPPATGHRTASRTIKLKRTIAQFTGSRHLNHILASNGSVVCIVIYQAIV